jgi:DNA anti-recombination protein RmuC
LKKEVQSLNEEFKKFKTYIQDKTKRINKSQKHLESFLEKSKTE